MGADVSCYSRPDAYSNPLVSIVPNNGFVFLIDTANARGEMRVADYAHDFIEELDWSPEGESVFKSLFEATKHVEALIQKGGSRWGVKKTAPR